MIRRAVGNEFWLIAQHDHALLSGELARHVGSAVLAAPSTRAVVGIELHDCGWPIHDDAPTLNEQGLPLDVFESPRPVSLEVWQASADRAAARDDYAGLLVSLHVLALSTTSTTASPPTGSATARGRHVVPPAPARSEATAAKSRFELNRFQHNQIELLETLRRKLGLPVDVPLRLGLAEAHDDAGEQTLHFDFRLLQAMDRLSLALCCTTPPSAEIRPLLSAPGRSEVTLRVKRLEAAELAVGPWPFVGSDLQVAVPFRRVPARRYASPDELRTALASSTVEQLCFRLSPG